MREKICGVLWNTNLTFSWEQGESYNNNSLVTGYDGRFKYFAVSFVKVIIDDSYLLLIHIIAV
jgi:hypothetical protein